MSPPYSESPVHARRRPYTKWGSVEKTPADSGRGSNRKWSKLCRGPIYMAASHRLRNRDCPRLLAVYLLYIAFLALQLWPLGRFGPCLRLQHWLCGPLPELYECPGTGHGFEARICLRLRFSGNRKRGRHWQPALRANILAETSGCQDACSTGSSLGMVHAYAPLFFLAIESPLETLQVHLP